jgi:GT2 family glycosyltransferase
MTGSVDIIIVNWNAGNQIKVCIDSIISNRNSLINKIIVVDNASTDKSDVDIDTIENVTLIRSDKNLGFGKACNLAAKLVNSEYILFLNPDAALFADTLSKSLNFMQDPTNANVGICGVQLLDEAGNISRSCARYPSALHWIIHALALDKIFPHQSLLMVDWDHSKTIEVNHVMGAYLLVRRTVFNLLDGFDERFFVYYEDLDFSYRAHLAGWKSLYLSDVQAFHAGGGTSKQVKAHRLFYSLRSRLLYSYKHYSYFSFFLVLLATFFIEPLTRSFYNLLICSWSGLKETSVAYGMLLRWLPLWILKGETR